MALYSGPNFERAVRLQLHEGELRIPISPQGLGPDVEAWNCSLRLSGRIRLDQPGTHAFWLSADDGARLWIDGELLANHWPSEPRTHSPLTLTVREPGSLSFVLDASNRTGEGWLALEWQPPGGERRLLTGSDFTLDPHPAAGHR
jgi:hypothetical protein